MLKNPRLFVSALFATATVMGLHSVAWAQQQGAPYHGPQMWGGGWWMIFGPLTMILMIAAIVIVVVLAIRWLAGPSHHEVQHQPAGKTPLDILKARFARGEIDEKEFKARRQILED